MNGAAQITLNIDIYDDQPVLRYSLSYHNLTGARVRHHGRHAAFTFADSGSATPRCA